MSASGAIPGMAAPFPRHPGGATGPRQSGVGLPMV